MGTALKMSENESIWETEYNYYDNMRVDVAQLFNQAHQEIAEKPRSWFKRALFYYPIATLAKFGWYEKLVDAGFLRGWFREFYAYWQKYLKGRPLRLHDFFILHSNYRVKFQKSEVQEGLGAEAYLQAWQNNKNLYLIFGTIYKYSLTPFWFYRFEKYIKNGDHVLEYGCGIAPVVYGLSRYSKKRGLKYTIADIEQINFHYAKTRLRGVAETLTITPYQNPLPEQPTFNVSILITVMEHLPDPLNTVKWITKSLKTGGVFVFDYFLSEGEGLDTVEAIKQRKDVLDFINEHYDIIYGKLLYDESMEMTVGRLKA